MTPAYGTDPAYDAWIEWLAERAEAAAEQRYSAQRELDNADREARQR